MMFYGDFSVIIVNLKIAMDAETYFLMYIITWIIITSDLSTLLWSSYFPPLDITHELVPSAVSWNHLNFS